VAIAIALAPFLIGAEEAELIPTFEGFQRSKGVTVPIVRFGHQVLHMGAMAVAGAGMGL
jgi:hypothetical protein